MLYYFGYVNTPNNKDNPLGFYDYEEHDPEHLASVNGYQKQNEEMIKRVSKMTDD